MERYLEKAIKKDLEEKIVVLSGPRQVGKTTLSRQLYASHVYLNFDSSADRKMIRAEEWTRDARLVVFDELHKMKGWKSWIKGVYDKEGVPPALLVTGSARLEALRKGGDSLAGRFFAHRLHPLTVKEICGALKESPAEALDGLIRFGGFPEPYLKKSETFAARWRRTHIDTIIREDLLDLERVREVRSMEILIDLLRARVGSSTSYASLAGDLQVSIHTVKHWLEILENLYVVFSVRPYSRNIARSILKEPKYYFYDTGAVEGDLGAKLENVVAQALWREIHLLEDTTGRKAALHYLRDREKHEVDFLVVIDNKPVLMAEVKAGDDSFSPPLLRFRDALKRAGAANIEAVQLVHGLKRKKSTSGVNMSTMADFLSAIDLAK
jgi:predicted AAA+ superfamily ATPase